MTVSTALAAFVADLEWAAVPERVRTKVGEHILDTVGVMCAGTLAPQSGIVARSLTGAPAARNCSVVGTARRLDPRDAAFANAFNGRIHTFDDTLEAGPVHPGSSVIAAALATAEAIGASGTDLLRGVLAGYEVAARVSLGLGPTHYARGFHSTGTCNAFGAAAAAGGVRRLSAAAVTNALGLAGGMAAGVRQYQIDGSIADSAVNGAHAAMAGVMAADLAAAGLGGPAGILDGRLGIGTLTSSAPDFAAMTGGLGRDYRFLAVALKPYPSCRFTHGPIREVIGLAEAHAIAPARVRSVELATFRQSIEVSDRPRPQTRSDALLSHQHTIAAALHRRRFTLAELGPECVADPSVRALAGRVSVVHDAALEARYPQSWPHRIRLTLDDGAVLQAISENPPGGEDWPLSRAEVLAKFQETAVPALGQSQTQQLGEALLGLAAATHLRTLQSLLCTREQESVADPSRRAREEHA